MTTQFGLLVTNQQAIGRDQVAALDEQSQVVTAVRDGGWDSVFAAQHHLSESFAHIQPLPCLGRLAAETGDLRVGVMIYLLALHNPVDVAESFANLDIVTGGRLIFGVGLGYRDVEYDAFGVPSGEKVRRFTENLRIVEELGGSTPTSPGAGWTASRLRSVGSRSRGRPSGWPRTRTPPCAAARGWPTHG